MPATIQIKDRANGGFRAIIEYAPATPEDKKIFQEKLSALVRETMIEKGAKDLANSGGSDVDVREEDQDDLAKPETPKPKKRRTSRKQPSSEECPDADNDDLAS